MDAFFQWLGSNSVASTAMIVFLGIVVTVYIVAFLQGREVSFWPPKIGEKSKSENQVEKAIDLEMSMIKEGIVSINNRLKDVNYHPDFIIAFSRSSAVFAGMLANHMKIVEMLVIPRKQSSTSQAKFDVGYCLTLNTNALRDKKILLVCYAIETGKSFENGIEFLRTQGLHDNYKIASFYISPAIRKRYPEVLAVHVASAADVMKKTPWTINEYHRV